MTLDEEEEKNVQLLREESREWFGATGVMAESPYTHVRWLRAFDGDMAEVRARMRRAGMLAQLFEVHTFADRPLFGGEVGERYDGLNYVGPCDRDDMHLVVEFAGRLDPFGLLKSVPSAHLLLNRFVQLRRAQTHVHATERETGRQSGIVYIYDCAEATMDPRLLPLMAGPMRVMWTTVGDQLPELIHKLVVVNFPRFGYTLYSALRRFLPERTASKIVFTSGWDDARAVLLSLVAEHRLPKHYGGTLVDENGDALCRQWVNVPTKPIPTRHYWRAGQTTLDDVENVHMRECSVAANAHAVLHTLHIDAHSQYIHLHIKCAKDVTVSMDVQCPQDTSHWEEYMPPMELPGIDTHVVNTLCVRQYLPAHGPYAHAVVRVRVHNSASWFRHARVLYHVRVTM